MRIVGLFKLDMFEQGVKGGGGSCTGYIKKFKYCITKYWVIKQL